MWGFWMQQIRASYAGYLQYSRERRRSGQSEAAKLEILVPRAEVVVVTVLELVLFFLFMAFFLRLS